MADHGSWGRPVSWKRVLTALAVPQMDMTPAGKAVVPSATEYEKRLLDVKYRIFRESIDIQRRWRNMINSVEK